ncbi:unnamed protein product, partial [Oppiella nova]
DKHTFDSERADPPPRAATSEPPSEVSSLSSFASESESLSPLVVVKRESVVRRLDVRHALRTANGKFHNPWSLSWEAPSLARNLLRLGRSAHLPSRAELDRLLPVLEPDFASTAPPPDSTAITWLGHSTVLVRMDGVSVLTDPMFSDRASPSQAVGPKRYRRAPCSVHDLPPDLDAVVISHAHYDHLDRNSVLVLNARFGADLRFFVPQGLGQWMRALGVENVVELEWWQESHVPDKSDVSFVFLPASHWSRRTLNDDNRVLWGGWAVVGPTQRFFFAGDTGYCDAFRQIGRLYGPFSAAAIPIGAYEPRSLLRCHAVAPEEAVEIHEDIGSAFSLAIHWGTFALTDEHYLEPPRRLRDALASARLPAESFVAFLPGETRVVSSGGRVVRSSSQRLKGFE